MGESAFCLLFSEALSGFWSSNQSSNLQIYHQICAQCRKFALNIALTSFRYGVATISRLLKFIGLFCKWALQKRLYSAKETYDFQECTNRSHPIVFGGYILLTKYKICHQICPWLICPWFCSEFFSCARVYILHSLCRVIIWIVIFNPITKFALDFAPVALRCVMLSCLCVMSQVCHFESKFDPTKTTQSNCNLDIIISPSFFLEHLMSHFRDLLGGSNFFGNYCKIVKHWLYFDGFWGMWIILLVRILSPNLLLILLWLVSLYVCVQNSFSL